MDRVTVTETYSLSGETLPSLPLPHDCGIRRIEEDDEKLVIVFKDGISGHDAVRAIHPDAESLRITFHRFDSNVFPVEAYRYKRGRRREGYMAVKSVKKLMKCADAEPTYLDHYVAYNGVIVQLFVGEIAMLMISADRVVYEWKLRREDRSPDRAEPA